MLLYDQNIIGASSGIFVNLRKSSVIFGKSPKNIQKHLPYLRNNFGKPLEIFGKWSEIFGKLSKTSSLVCLCNKQNITCRLVDMNFIFSSLTQHLTSERSERVRYRVECSKIKFISTRGHVISSIYNIKLFTASYANNLKELLNHGDAIPINYARRFKTKLAYSRIFQVMQVTPQFFVTNSDLD